ncbi:hypothetical protein NL108_012785 [Boleophthalmus pectinirostris]|nr:hypothetical protein NL108_012785 [Boleophthalmus pectinirostris]
MTVWIQGSSCQLHHITSDQLQLSFFIIWDRVLLISFITSLLISAICHSSSSGDRVLLISFIISLLIISICRTSSSGDRVLLISFIRPQDHRAQLAPPNQSPWEQTQKQNSVKACAPSK